MGGNRFSEKQIFSKDHLIEILDSTIDKTLGEVDVEDVFRIARDNPKVKGIAGMVIEQSVLGYDADPKQDCDILVDGVEVEVKSTGIILEKNGKHEEFAAKEPMSITAVSPDCIVGETFLESHFWRKLEHPLFIYYLYTRPGEKIKAYEYAEFSIKGYEFHLFSADEVNILKNDWLLIQKSVLAQKSQGVKEITIPHELRKDLMLIDTAPKIRPRFRLKKTFVDTIVKDYFNKDKVPQHQVPWEFNKFSDLDRKCHELSSFFSNYTVQGLIDWFSITTNPKSKQLGESITLRMFDSDAGKLNQIELFEKVGLIGKTIKLTGKNTATEDMKLFRIDFNEFLDPDIEFEDSFIYDYFANHQFICIIFKEEVMNADPDKQRFLGFKRLSFDDGFIYREVRSTWEEIRDLVWSGRLQETILVDKNGNPRKNKKGNYVTSINFPKSRHFPVFVRGDGADSDDKPEHLCGIDMYRQWIWIEGNFIVKMLDGQDYL